jgi:hypothetical protein
VSNKERKIGKFQVQFGRIRSETTRLGRKEILCAGEGVKFGKVGTQAEFQTDKGEMR